MSRGRLLAVAAAIVVPAGLAGVWLLGRDGGGQTQTVATTSTTAAEPSTTVTTVPSVAVPTTVFDHPLPDGRTVHCSGAVTTYTIQQGDRLSTIVETGVERVPPLVLYQTIEAISVANGLPSPDAIRFGDELLLPERCELIDPNAPSTTPTTSSGSVIN
jgi:hypothetical protein